MWTFVLSMCQVLTNSKQNIHLMTPFESTMISISKLSVYLFHSEWKNQGKTCYLYNLWDEIQRQNIWVKPFTCTLVLNWDGTNFF